MSMTFLNDTSVNLIQYFPEVTCFCSVTKVPFFSRVDIEFVPGKKLLEFIAFDEWLMTLSDKSYTIESLCDAIFDKLTEEIGYTNMSVSVNATTVVHASAKAIRVRNVEAERARANQKAKIHIPR